MPAKKRRSKTERASETVDPSLAELTRFHLRVGWCSLFLFVILGVVLESLHGFKVAWYLNVGQESRRLLWRLAHAHGTFLALVNIGLATTLWIRGREPSRSLRIASRSLFAATVLVPSGFLFGGTVFYSADPGLGIILLPIGALLLIVAVGLAAGASLGRIVE